MNYTYAQMKEMQEQAFERVREMQKKADYTAKQAMADLASPANAEDAKGEEPLKKSAEEPRKPAKIPDSPRRVSMPIEFPDRREKHEKYEKHENRPPNGGGGLAGLFGSGAHDTDSALLLTLMMLLNAENVGEELLLALMYILNG